MTRELGRRRRAGRLCWTVAVAMAMATGTAAGPPEENEDEAAIDRLLTSFHLSASRADGDAYFELFDDEAVFLGTDPGERWTRPEFEDYARARFARGQGWTYTELERHVEVAPGGAVAWFDEVLDNASYGTCRGTGVVVRTADGWKVRHYSLTFLVPNEAAAGVVDYVRGGEWVSAESPR